MATAKPLPALALCALVAAPPPLAGAPGAPSCVGAGEPVDMEAGGECCVGLVASADPGGPPPPAPRGGRACAAGFAACKGDADCCSGSCRAHGTCAPVVRCLAPLGAGADCSAGRVCGPGLHCIDQSVPDHGMGVCARLAHACGKDSDCCSSKCAGKACVRHALCGRCARQGTEPSRDSPCCPGTYRGAGGPCVADHPVGAGP